VAVVLAAVAGLACHFIGVTSRSAWGRTELAVLGIFFLALGALAAMRSRAYSQRTPWLVGSFSLLAIVALVLVFWPSNTILFIAAMSMGSMLLGAGGILRAKPLSGPVSQRELFELASLAASMLLTLGLMEALVRAAPGVFSAEIQQLLRTNRNDYGVANPYIGHLHTPNSAILIAGRDFRALHHVDAFGFRNHWPWPDQADIVVVGDSVTFGYGVADEQAWPAVLARAVMANHVMNLGLIGAGPQQYLRVYETFGVNLKPKLVLVGFFAQNDFWDADAFDRWLKSGAGGNYMVWRDFGQPERVSFSLRHPVVELDSLSRSTLYPLVRRSYLYNLLSALRGGEGAPPESPRILRFADGSRLQLNRDQFLSHVALAQRDRPEFHLALEALGGIRAAAAQNGARALIVLLPGKEEVYLPLLEREVPSPTSALREVFEELGVSYLDLVPAFRSRAAAGDRLFFEADGHPNDLGQALIAQLVLTHLKDHSREYGLDD
jgi:lysophospholipase L1-like esterase